MGILINLVFKFLSFIGAGYIILGYLIYVLIEGQYANRGMQTSELAMLIQLIAICGGFVGAFLTTIQNTVRLVKPDFELMPFLGRIMHGIGGIFAFIISGGVRGVSALDKRKRKQVGETFENLDNDFVGLESGVVFGKIGRRYIVMPQSTEGHIMVVGGQGSGKSSCVAIPTLLNYESSIFAIDIKGELSEHRRNYGLNKVRVFDPMDFNSPHYNPYMILKQGDIIQGAREMAHCLIPLTKEDKDPYWKQSAQNLLIACILHFSNIDYDFPTTCNTIMQNNINDLMLLLDNSPVEEVKLFINQFVGADTKLLASIYSTLANEIMLFATDKNIQRALSKSENSIAPVDLEKNIDIFIKLDEDKMEQWKPLLNLMVSQFLKSFEKRKDKTDKKILFMIDEFARIGKLESITNGLATLRSKGIQIMIILQSLAQLDAIYGQDVRKIITDNCNYKIILNASDVDTQEYFSKLVGTTEFEKKSKSVSNKATDPIRNNGISTSSEEKRIIKPESFAYLENPIVFTPKGYFQPNKVKWYEDNIFIERNKITEKEII